MTAILENEIAKLTDAEIRELIDVLQKRVNPDVVLPSHIEYIRRELEDVKQNPNAGLSMDEFLAQRR